MSKTAGTPFTRITRDEAALLWARNCRVWALLNSDLRVIKPLRTDDHEIIGMTWSMRIIEDGPAEFYVRGKPE